MSASVQKTKQKAPRCTCRHRNRHDPDCPYLPRTLKIAAARKKRKEKKAVAP